MKITVTHLINGLAKGGAETMLYQILRYRQNPNVIHRVISMTEVRPYYKDAITSLGIDVLQLSFGKKPLSSFFRAISYLRKHPTDVLCCWMYHANLLGYVLKPFSRVKRLVWNVRHSDLSPGLTKKTTLFVNRLCAKRSHKVAAIAYNGDKAREIHEASGYVHENGIVFDNMVDIAEYKPDEAAAKDLRNELGLSAEQRIVLSVARYHPIKDTPTFIRAISLLRKEKETVVAVLCGADIKQDNEKLAALCEENGLTIGKDVFLLGLRHDVPRLMAGSDLFVLHSASEAFPNVLAQAMACGCLCITTDVGEAARILDRPDRTVRVGDSAAIAEKGSMLLSMDAKCAMQEGAENRDSVRARFGVADIISAYEKLYFSNEGGEVKCC